MINQCLEDINEPTELYKFYSQQSPNKLPSLLICNDKRRQQNIDIENLITDNRPVETSNGVFEPFNVRNLANSGYGLQKGYSNNIDIDSHLKNINYYTDKCFYDNYKTHPSQATSTLNQYTNTLVHNYNNNQRQHPLNCIGPQDKFKLCNGYESYNVYQNEPVFYKFSNDNYCRNYPCQRLFHNQTKRKALIGNRHNPFNINPTNINYCDI